MKWLSLFVVAILTSANTASATLLADGNVLWDFEGTATTPGPAGSPPVNHTVVGSLLFAPVLFTTIDIEALVDGVDVVSGFVLANSTDGAPGTLDQISSPRVPGQAISSATSPYSLPIDNVNASNPFFAIDLSDADGTLFDGAAFPLPPAQAPDIGVFEVAELSILQEGCVTQGQNFPCPNSGLHFVSEVFDLRFTSFSDPVPEPAALGWASFAGFCAIALRRRRFGVSHPPL